ncbi:MAG: Bax inhibitor-1/YccA family protein [Planctomycetota bacterium]
MSQNGTGYEHLARPVPRKVAFADAALVMAKVFGWMSAGLAITAVVAMFTAQNQMLKEIFVDDPWILIPVFLVEILLVWAISSAVDRISAGVATVLFITFAVVNGLTLSFLFLAFDLGSLATMFFVTSATFGVMALYGYTTRRDLTSLGNLCTMLLLGLSIGCGTTVFTGSSAIGRAITCLGILIFVGLTAYDVQNIRTMAETVYPDTEEGQAVAIHGALELYLDFLNLFLDLIRLLGHRK